MQHALVSRCNTSENWDTVCGDYPMHWFVPCSCHGWVTLDQGGHVLDFIWPCYVAKALVLDLDFAQLLDSTALLIQIFCLWRATPSVAATVGAAWLLEIPEHYYVLLMASCRRKRWNSAFVHLLGRDGQRRGIRVTGRRWKWQRRRPNDDVRSSSTIAKQFSESFLFVPILKHQYTCKHDRNSRSVCVIFHVCKQYDNIPELQMLWVHVNDDIANLMQL